MGLSSIIPASALKGALFGGVTGGPVAVPKQAATAPHHLIRPGLLACGVFTIGLFAARSPQPTGRIWPFLLVSALVHGAILLLLRRERIFRPPGPSPDSSIFEISFIDQRKAEADPIPIGSPKEPTGVQKAGELRETAGGAPRLKKRVKILESPATPVPEGPKEETGGGTFSLRMREEDNNPQGGDEPLPKKPVAVPGRGEGLTRWYRGPLEKDPLFKVHAERYRELGPDDPRHKRKVEEENWAVRPDGTVDFRSKSVARKVGDTALSLIPQVRALVSPFYKPREELSDAQKRAILEGTFETRAVMADAFRTEMRSLALQSIDEELETLWRSAGGDPARQKEVKEILFDRWDECLEERNRDGEGAEVIAGAMLIRAKILVFIRRRLPPGSPHAFSPEELRELNRRRTSMSRFDPYGSQSPAPRLKELEAAYQRQVEELPPSSLSQQLQRVWQDDSNSPAGRRRQIFAIWDQMMDPCNSLTTKRDEEGTPYVPAGVVREAMLNRHTVILWIRENLAVDGPDAFAAEELVQLNRTRRSTECFDPYQNLLACGDAQTGHLIP